MNLPRAISTFLLTLALLLPAPVMAQQADVPKPAAGGDFDRNKYVEATLGNLINAYLALGLRDPEALNVLKEYTQYNYCSMYYQYAVNDFSWKRVLQGVSLDTKTRASTFPTHFKLVSKVSLGEYDFNQNGFKFSPPDLFRNAGLFLLGEYVNFEDCRGTFPDVSAFPNRYQVRVDNPLNLEIFPLDQKGANELILRIDRSRYGRVVTAIIYLRMAGDKWQEIPLINGRIESIVNGHIDKIEFYEDPETTKLLYEMKF